MLEHDPEWTLYRAEQARELDRRAIEERGIPGYTLMCRAGEAVFAAVRECRPGARRLAVVCGAGNNGGDGFVVARLAHRAGREVEVLELVEASRLRGDAATARSECVAAGVTPHPFDAARLARAEVVVDAVFGTGLDREVGGAWRAALEAIDGQGAPVVAVDIPSGLHADTGAVLGVAVHAAATVTFIARKAGLYSGEGPAYRGALYFDALGVPADLYGGLEPAALRLDPVGLARLLAPRPRSAHKGCYGHVLLVGGERGMGGALRMAGAAAGRVGAGLVSLATRAEHAAALSAGAPELMAHGVGGPGDLGALLGRATVVAVGPGLGRGRWGVDLFGSLLDSRLPLVVDADALNLLAREPVARGNWVLTPHPGEAARLLSTDTGAVQRDRYAMARALAERYAAVVVLKGAGTVIQAGEGAPWVAEVGNPGMASGGMGDVLTGVIAALLAQGLDPAAAARLGVYLHGAAADAAARAGGERGLLASDLLPELRRLANPHQFPWNG